MNLREIDRLVATEVLGWEYREAVYTWGELFSPAKYVTKDGREVLPHELPHFSTDLLDAFHVGEVLRDRGILITVEFLIDKYKALYDGQFGAYAETAPLAICLATLKAVGVEVEGMDNEQ
jgi:Phage ABA sandwich domain